MELEIQYNPCKVTAGETTITKILKPEQVTSLLHTLHWAGKGESGDLGWACICKKKKKYCG